MKKKILTYTLFASIMIVSLVFSGCETIQGLFNKVPEQYTEGIKYDRDFPDDVFEIYDGAIVFESRKLFDEIILTLGTEDDIDDVIDFYRDFFEENEIGLIEESEEKDEYYASGIFEGYEFKIKIEEADGEYIEDLFESIIYISAKETKEEAIKSVSPTPSATTSPEPIQTSSTAVSPEPTPAPTVDTSGETQLTYLEPGSWEMFGLYIDGMETNAEATMFINYDNTGTFYYYDYESDDRGFFEFTYDLTNGVFDMYIDGDPTSYLAYYDDGILHLSEQDSDLNMYFANWSENYGVYPSEYSFTAYGDWIYYEPDTGYIETIAIWPDGTGYVNNWDGSDKNYFMYWSFEDGLFSFSDEMENEYSYEIVHRGEVFELHQDNGSVFYYNRVSGKYWLTGYYYMQETNDDTVSDWSFSLYSDGSCDYTLNGNTGSSYWTIDNATGKINITINGYDIILDYHYDIEGLHLWDSYGGLYYDFVQVG